MKIQRDDQWPQMNDEEDEVRPLEQIRDFQIVIVHLFVDLDTGCVLEVDPVETRAAHVADRKPEYLTCGTAEANKGILAVCVEEKTIAKKGLEKASEIHSSVASKT